MLFVKLTRIKSSHDKLRTDSMEGRSPNIPEVGFCIEVFGKPLTPGASFRKITTSEIMEVEYYSTERKFVFSTQNSTYELDVFGEEDPLEYQRVKH